AHRYFNGAAVVHRGRSAKPLRRDEMSATTSMGPRLFTAEGFRDLKGPNGKPLDFNGAAVVHRGRLEETAYGVTFPHDFNGAAVVHRGRCGRSVLVQRTQFLTSMGPRLFTAEGITRHGGCRKQRHNFNGAAVVHRGRSEPSFMAWLLDIPLQWG